MKKFFNIFTVAASLLTLVYCSEAEQPFIEGDSYLHFAKAQSGDAYVALGSGNGNFKVPYGVTKAVENDHTVELVLDQSKSTAVLGTDFTLSSSTLSSGSVYGETNINVKESAAAAGKKAVFKIKSATLPSANFKDEYTVTFNLRCPISNFVGDFENTESFWNNPGTPVEIVENPAVPNQLLIKDYLDIGKDLVLNYNPDTYAITFANQNTGYYSSANGGFIWLRPSTSKTSTFNPCTRVMTLNVYYYIPNVGNYGDQVEKFVGN